MKLFILMIMMMVISSGSGVFYGCPMDGCESTLSGYVDIRVDGFDKDLQWQRADLLNNASRGCVSNSLSSLICAVDLGYVSINVTNGQLLWSFAVQPEEGTITVSLPVINYQGFSIIANSTECTFLNPQGGIGGTFSYAPKLIPPLAGPFVTADGQIVVADLNSFVGIEDSGIPLGVRELPAGYRRLSRSVSLDRDNARWYLIVQHNTTSALAIVAAETTGSIVQRLRIAWVYEYTVQNDSCNGKEGPLLSTDRQWLFVANTTGILVIADNGDSASTEYIIPRPGLCANDMVYSETDSTLLVLDKSVYTIIVLNVSTQNVSYISLTSICGEEIIGQLSRMTIFQNQCTIILVVTSSRQAVLLLVDYNLHKLLARFDLGNVRESTTFEPLTQLIYTQTDDQHFFITIAHQAVGLATIRLLASEQEQLGEDSAVFYSVLVNT